MLATHRDASKPSDCEAESNSGGLNSYLQLGLYTTTKSLRAFASMRAMNTMLIARSLKSLESVDSAFIEI